MPFMKIGMEGTALPKASCCRVQRRPRFNRNGLRLHVHSGDFPGGLTWKGLVSSTFAIDPCLTAMAGFDTQQCVEKYVKALSVMERPRFPKKEDTLTAAFMVCAQAHISAVQPAACS